MAYRVLLVAVLHNMDRDKQVDKETKSNGQMAVVLDVTKLFVKVSKKGSKEGRKHGGKRIWVLMRKREREREKLFLQQCCWSFLIADSVGGWLRELISRKWIDWLDDAYDA